MVWFIGFKEVIYTVGKLLLKLENHSVLVLNFLLVVLLHVSNLLGDFFLSFLVIAGSEQINFQQADLLGQVADSLFSFS